MAEHPHGAAPKQRPLSPFVTIYRWPITMFTSITHRVTGVALYAGMLLVAWWLIAAASGPEAFAPIQALAASLIGQIVLFGFVWSLTYHFLNGIRHLAWDIGYGFDVPTANKTGVLVVTLSVLVAIGLFVLATMQRGAMG